MEMDYIFQSSEFYCWFPMDEVVGGNLVSTIPARFKGTARITPGKRDSAIILDGKQHVEVINTITMIHKKYYVSTF